jgi:hypothetical protein
MLQDWPLVQMSGGPETPGGVSGRGLEINEDTKARSELLKVEESESVKGIIWHGRIEIGKNNNSGNLMVWRCYFVFPGAQKLGDIDMPNGDFNRNRVQEFSTTKLHW